MTFRAHCQDAWQTAKTGGKKLHVGELGGGGGGGGKSSRNRDNTYIDMSSTTVEELHWCGCHVGHT